MLFLTQKQTPLEVITLEPAEILRISQAKFKKIGYDTDFGDKICRFAAKGLFIQKQNKQINLLTKTSSQRYSELVGVRPDIIQRVPQKIYCFIFRHHATKFEQN